MNTTKLGGCLENFPFREWFKWEIRGGWLRVPCFVKSWGSNSLRMKACHGLRLLTMDIKNGVKFGDLEEVGNFLIQVQEL